MRQRRDVLRETRAAVAGARVDEVVTDARIRADAEPHVLDVRAEALGEIGELVHEADLGGQHRVGRVLGQLRRADVHGDEPVMLAVEGLVEQPEQLGGARVVGADDDAIRAHEVLDRGAFLEEFRVGHHVEVDRDAALRQRAGDFGLDAVGGAHRDRRLVDDDAVLVHVLADRARHGQHVLHVRRAILVRRRADRDELEQPVRDALGHVGGELQAARLAIAGNDGIQPGSKIGISPAFNRSIFPWSMSTQTTLLPTSARQAPVTSPT
jgi:hypothetical protein